MNREEMFKNVLERFNNQEGVIVKLVKDYPGYTRDKFNLDIKKYGYTKDAEKNIYIIPGEEIEGQINILEAPGEPQSKDDYKSMETIIEEVEKPTEDKTEPTKTNKSLKRIIKVADRKKKTFEINIELEQLIKIQSAIEGMTINDWVNDILWKAIPDTTRKIKK